MTQAAPATAAQQAPTTSTGKPYEPRDPVFYLAALTSLAVALLPPGPSEDDREQAEARAAVLAQVLDGAPFPDDFVVPRFQMQIDELAELGVVLSPTAQNPQNPRTVTAGEQTKLRERAKAKGLPIETRAISDRQERLRQQQRELLERLTDLSEPVRAAALQATAIRLSGRDDLTGAKHLLAEELGILVEEIERALRIAEALKLPTRTIGADTSRERAETIAPYPASVVMTFFQAARLAEQEAAEGGGERSHTEAELRELLAEELRQGGKDKLAALATAPDQDLGTFARFADASAPGLISPRLREFLGLDAKAEA